MAQARSVPTSSSTRPSLDLWPDLAPQPFGPGQNRAYWFQKETETGDVYLHLNMMIHICIDTDIDIDIDIDIRYWILDIDIDIRYTY